MRNQRGFSLIEMIIVMFIAGIITGIAIPVYLNMKPSIKLNGAARQIMGDFMWARMQSVNQNNRFKIFFINEHEYEILDDDNNNGAHNNGETIIKKNLKREKISNKDLKYTINDVIFDPVPAQNPIFEPKGTLYWPLGITVNVSNPAGTKTITVATTGRVKIH
ncbi:MAG: GspH/FimT family pseudopilin [Candidatus Brocadiaceae bacterium]